MADSRLHLATACGVVCVLLLAGFQGHHSRRVALGQDEDWHVKGWSKEHMKAVSSNSIDEASERNIWHSRNQAWSGIDDILPTGGAYSYQTNHAMNGNEARLLDYMKMVKSSLKQLKTKFPTAAPKDLKSESPAKFEQRLNELNDVIDSEGHSVTEVADQTRKERMVHDKAQPMMLVQKPGAKTQAAAAAVPAAAAAAAELAAAKAKATVARGGQGRVYVDEAMYGEGIRGDIRSLGHHKEHWGSKSAAADMDNFFDTLTSS